MGGDEYISTDSMHCVTCVVKWHEKDIGYVTKHGSIVYVVGCVHVRYM